ncbi:MAG: STAS domain-containing protein [Nocardioides sp.]
MSAHRATPDALPSLSDASSRRRKAVTPAVAVRLYRSGHWVVIEVEGEMDIQVVPLVPPNFGGAESFVVFELRGVTFMDAGGLGVIAATSRQANEGGGCVRLVAPSRPAQRLLSLARSDQTFGVFDGLDEAVSTPYRPRAAATG